MVGVWFMCTKKQVLKRKKVGNYCPRVQINKISKTTEGCLKHSIVDVYYKKSWMKITEMK